MMPRIQVLAASSAWTMSSTMSSQSSRPTEKAQKIVADSVRPALLGRIGCVGHRRRMLDERLGVAEADRARRSLSLFMKAHAGGSAPGNLECDKASRSSDPVDGRAHVGGNVGGQGEETHVTAG